MRVGALKENQQALRSELRNVIDSLGEEATADQIQEAVGKFRGDHRSDIDAVVAEAQELRGEVNSSSPARAERSERGQMPPEVAANLTELEEKRATFRTAREQFVDAIQAAVSEEDRSQIKEDFRQAQSDLVEEMKNQRKTIRDQVKDFDLSGDRRPDS